MSTPRTDNACGWPWGHHGRIESSDLRWSPDGPFVHSSVCRQLERELTVANNWVEHHQNHCDDLIKENAALREALQCIAGNHGKRSPITLTEAQEEARDALAFSKEAQP